jgi:lipid-A-disaccharide synthase
MHGAKLAGALSAIDPKARFSYTGGVAMSQLVGDKIIDIDQMAFMGFAEVLLNLGNILTIQRIIKRSIDLFKPDIIIFIDYPGLNLRLARWAKGKGYKTAYYILPKAWAWNKSRVYDLKNFVDLNLSIFPFEGPFFKYYGVPVHYVGNPSMSIINSLNRIDEPNKKPVLALLPGSRKQEVKRILPVMLEAVKDRSAFEIIVSKAKNLPLSLYPSGLNLSEDYLDLLKKARYAIVTSGTATLEAALLDVPQIVVYRSSWLSMKIARLLVKLKYISLANLIVDEPIVKELIQEDANPGTLREELKKLLDTDEKEFFNNYQKIKNELGQMDASQNAAQLIFDLVKP